MTEEMTAAETIVTEVIVVTADGTTMPCPYDRVYRLQVLVFLLDLDLAVFSVKDLACLKVMTLFSSEATL